MSNCIDTRFRDMAHAYELDLLTEEDRRAFEIHLIECDACFMRVRRLGKVARLMNTDRDVKTAVGEIAGPVPARLSWLRSRVLGVSLAAAAVLVLLILNPWNLRLDLGDSAVAAEDRLVVLYFENLTDPTDSLRLGRVASNLLITDLAQAREVQVVSNQRLYATARSLGLSGPHELKTAQAEELLHRTQSRWLLASSISLIGDQLTLTAELVAAESGDIETTFRIAGEAGDDIFPLVDRLSEEVRVYFGSAPTQAQDRPVADLTTTSFEAYRSYLEGIDHFERIDYEKAINAFQSALDIDPGLAMAYYYLARLLDRTLLDLAVEHIDQAGPLEQRIIRSAAMNQDKDIEGAIAEMEIAVEEFPGEIEAWRSLATYYQRERRYRDAIGCLHEAIALDSLFKAGYNRLAYLYDHLGDVDSAVWAIDHYISVAPGEANPYDTKGDILGRHGRLDEAIAAFEEALRIRPDFTNARSYLGFMQLFAGQYARADSSFMRLVFADQISMRLAARLYRSYPYIRRGLLDSALEVIETADHLASTPDALRGYRQQHVFNLQLAGLILSELGRYDEALDKIRESRRQAGLLPRPDSAAGRFDEISILLDAGRSEEALRAMEDYRLFYEVNPKHDTSFQFRLAEGILARYMGDTETALDMTRAAYQQSKRFRAGIQYGLALWKAGDFVAAEELLCKQALECSSPASAYGIKSVKLHYYLGQLLEEAGKPDEAAVAYARFLTLWQDADPITGAIVDARSRLNRLRSQP